MTQEKEHASTYRDWYLSCSPDVIRGQEPRIRNAMPCIRNSKTGKEVCIFTNYSQDDALLALAAPDLLEALHFIDIELSQHHDALGTNRKNGVYYALHKAREAIAKVKGE